MSEKQAKADRQEQRKMDQRLEMSMSLIYALCEVVDFDKVDWEKSYIPREHVETWMKELKDGTGADEG